MTISPGILEELDTRRAHASQTSPSNSLIDVIFSPGEVYCFDDAQAGANFWINTVAGYINETIADKFDQKDLDELYSQADATEQKYKTFTAGCQKGASGPYLKYLGTSSTVRDLVSLGDAILGQGQLIDYWGVSYGTILGFDFSQQPALSSSNPVCWFTEISS